MSKLKFVFCLNDFISPFSIHVLYWGAIAGNTYGVIWLFTHDNWAWIPALVFGLLSIRLIFESLILRFKIYEKLTKVLETGQG